MTLARMLRAWYLAFDQWCDRRRARRLRSLARFCRKVAGNAENLADALDPREATS